MIIITQIFLKSNLFFFLLKYILTITLIQPSNIISQNKVLYFHMQTHLRQSTFNISFKQSFSSKPILTYALNDYLMGDRFYYQNILTQISQIEKNWFRVSVYPVWSTYIYKLSIEYLAIGDNINFVSLSKSYLNPPIVSARSGNRNIVIRQSYNFSSYNTTGTAFIVGFYLQSITSFSIQIHLINITQFSYYLSISTESDCTINRLDVSYLFYSPTKSTNTYLIRDNAYCYRNAGKQVYEIIQDITMSVFMLGMSGFSGNTLNSTIDFGWSGEYINNLFNVTINTNNLTHICYQSIRIYSILSPNSPMPSSPNNLTLIIAIVFAILFTSVVVIIILVCRYRRRYYNQEKSSQARNKLSVVNMKQLPSLHF